ncbi:MAG: DUF6640 family protein [Pseudomonadota bacterium]
MRLIWKGVVTLVTLFYGIVPAIADMNETHLLNEGWSAHARVHGAWFLFFGAGMALVSLYLLWLRDEMVLPIVIGLLYVAGFFAAFLTAPLYGGALVDPNGVAVRILGIESNLFLFSVAGAVLIAALVKAPRAPGNEP